MWNPKSTTQLHFLIGGGMLKFGLREFTLITSLNCDEIPDVNTEDIKGGERPKKIYFEILKSMTMHYLNIMFNISMAGTYENRIRMAKLYFLKIFLLLRQESLSIKWDHVLMLDDVEHDSYPWGRIVFYLLLYFMNRVVGSKGQIGISMGGFIFLILVLAYEVIPTLSMPLNFFATRISSEVFWIINWAADIAKMEGPTTEGLWSPMVWSSFYKQILYVENHL